MPTHALLTANTSAVNNTKSQGRGIRAASCKRNTAMANGTKIWTVKWRLTCVRLSISSRPRTRREYLSAILAAQKVAKATAMGARSPGTRGSELYQSTSGKNATAAAQYSMRTTTKATLSAANLFGLV